MKRIIALLLAVMMVAATLALAGCKLTETEPESADETAEIDRSAIVASVGDEVVTMAEYQDMFDMYLSYYSQMGYDFTSDDTMLSDFQDFIIEMLLSEKVVIHQAKLSGMDELTEEEEAELAEECEQAINDMLDYYREQAEEEAAADASIDVEARIKELVEDESEYYTGSYKPYDEYIEWLNQETRDNDLYTRLQESTYADITVDKDDVVTWVSEQVAADTTAYTDDPGSYKDKQEYYEMYGGTPVMYAPEGYSRIYHILLTSFDEMPEEYATNSTRMSEIATEYGPLAFDDAISGDGANKDAMQALITEYNELKTANDTLSTEHFAEAKTNAETAYAELEAGGDFKEVMVKYSEDADFNSFDIFQEKGMLISDEIESSTDWSDEVKSEFAKLSVGEYSLVFSDADGYHIIYYVGDEPAGARSLDDYSDEIEALVLQTKQSDEWNALVETWMSDPDIFKDEELIRSLKG